MARITCRTPSTGKPLRIIQTNVANTFVTIAEAPDFSVPDASTKFPDRDPTDDTRAIRPGEIFFLTPMAAKNKDTVTRWVEVIYVTENAETIELAKVSVPAGDTALIPLQGRSLLKRVANNVTGDTLQVRAEIENIIDIWISAEEKTSNEHVGVE
jgi:alpha-ketoglutarate-dependent taurine dioxygenase